MSVPAYTGYFFRFALPNRPVAKRTHLVLLSHSAFFVTALLGLVLGIVAGNNTTSVEPLATVTVMAEGMAPFLKDMSLDEVGGGPATRPAGMRSN
jgi:hypothetical protein